MSLIDEIRAEVKDIAHDIGKGEDKAFGFWFLENYEDFSREIAEACIVDGPWDGGVDAFYFDEENSVLKIYQFKYSEDKEYIKKGFSDLQRSIKKEKFKNEIENAKAINIYLVSLVRTDNDLEKLLKNSLKHIKNWIKRRTNNSVDVDFEHIELTKFLSFSEQICGVELEVEFKSEIIIDNTIIGLINARIFHQHIEKEELFAFNIRKFLGMRRKSVNSEIKNTLEDGEKRNKFWLFNNGIVCLCSDYSESGNKETGKKYNTLRFKDFTIVNGAQTISTISKFIEENPAFDEPIWVFAKIIIVEKNDVEKAIELTKTSNTQTPASSRDLRAVDALHKHVSNWFKEYYDYIYLYRRGEKAKKDQKAIKLKDMVQAYFAFQIGKPNLAFANVGKIFSETDLYKEIFDEEYINLLRLIGTEDDKKEFIIDRLIPYLLLEEIRKQVKELTKQDIDNKWKSVVYHILWLYHELIPAKNISKLENLMQNYQLLIEQTIKDILNGIKDFCISKGYDIPRDLKSDQLLNGMKSDAFKQLSSIGEAKRKIAKLLP